ncbi:hypothetical protein MTR67_018337 [Solanum verrucosum]|uniref:Uncharacterized protein n=1 Tax=Solanum verrucosum TaxID=315347 RepID=A0AAF0TLH9_SOLVR|nr:hypothetical protein MTR67_018337 [Solanum verrucosum]
MSFPNITVNTHNSS